MYELFGGDDQEVKHAVWLRDWRRLPAQIAYAWQYIGRGSRLVAKFRRLGRFALLGPRGSGERIFTDRCERGAQIARMIGLPERVAAAILAMDEHWDGGGYPYALRRRTDPSVRADHRPDAGDGDLLRPRRAADGAARGARAARPMVRAGRRGRARRSGRRPRLLDRARGGQPRSRAGRRELATDEIPADDERLDRICDAFALIIDAKSPFTFEHSQRTAPYAVTINERLGADGVDPIRLRRPRSSTISGS